MRGNNFWTISKIEHINKIHVQLFCYCSPVDYNPSTSYTQDVISKDFGNTSPNLFAKILDNSRNQLSKNHLLGLLTILDVVLVKKNSV